jgi:hypothetical protein
VGRNARGPQRRLYVRTHQRPALMPFTSRYSPTHPPTHPPSARPLMLERTLHAHSRSSLRTLRLCLRTRSTRKTAVPCARFRSRARSTRAPVDACAPVTTTCPLLITRWCLCARARCCSPGVACAHVPRTCRCCLGARSFSPFFPFLQLLKVQSAGG